VCSKALFIPENLGIADIAMRRCLLRFDEQGNDDVLPDATWMA
jgi:hypothetical protein